MRARGSISVYAVRGQYNINVEQLEAVGDGTLLVAYEQLKKRLEAEGLFDSALKRPLPRFPTRVGIVTSPTGAALRDMLNILSRRTRTVHVLLSPTRVQGVGAASEIVRAIQLLNQHHQRSLTDGRLVDTIDVMIVGRGGGSLEDLWAFNEEEVARSIRASVIPVISAVGHETDVTIADFAADRRAPTPSAAAELVAEQEHDLARELEKHTNALGRAARYRLMGARSQLDHTGISRALQNVRTQLRESAMTTDSTVQRLHVAIARITSELKHEVKDLRHRLAAANPWARLSSAKQRQADLGARLIFAVRSQLRSAYLSVQESSDRLSKQRPETRLAGMRLNVSDLTSELQAAMRLRLRGAYSKVEQLDRRFAQQQPTKHISVLQLTLNNLTSTLSAAMQDRMVRNGGRLNLASNSLQALSPLAVLERGYAIAQDSDGRILRDAVSVATNDQVRVRLAKGKLLTRVEETDSK